MPLKAHIKHLIKEGGAISMAEFMQVVLAHPDYGYYKTAEPFGVEGDFTTGPEISQVFGELIGIWCADIWLKIGCPDDIEIVEFGPGRGTLMDDLLRATSHIPKFHESISISMIETSKRLADIQFTKLNHKHPRISWLENIDNLPQKPLILVANELFDALPVHQYIKQNGKWLEKMLSLDSSGELQFVYFQLESVAGAIPASTQHILKYPKESSIQNGAIIEICPLAITIMEKICAHIKCYGGAALIIDYGYIKTTFKNTISAIKNHKHHGILEDIGKADLSAHVDFGRLKNIAEDQAIAVYGPIKQGDFLRNMGIDFRFDKLAQNANEKQKNDLYSAKERLLGDTQMGKLFKVLGITSWVSPSGF